MECEVFIDSYSKLITVFNDKNYLHHFVPAKIVLPSDVQHMFSLPDSDRAVYLLNKISAPLECGETECFYKMLEIMQEHGNGHAQKLAENMKAMAVVREPIAPIEGAYVATYLCVKCIATLLRNSYIVHLISSHTYSTNHP